MPSFSDDDDDNNKYGNENSSDEDSSNDGRQSATMDYDHNDDDDHEDLRHLPLSVRLQRQEATGVKQKRRSKVTKENKDSQQQQQQQQEPARKKSTSSSKHAPTEVSSKRADFFRRGAPNLDNSGIGISINAHRYQPRDPRVAAVSSSSSSQQPIINTLTPQDEYLYELRKKEIAALKLRLQAWKMTGKTGQNMRKKLRLTASRNSTNEDVSMEHDKSELQRLLQEQGHYERAVLDQRAQAKVKESIQQLQQQPSNNNNNNRRISSSDNNNNNNNNNSKFGNPKKFYPKRRDLKQMQWQAKLELLKQQPQQHGDGGEDEMNDKSNKKSSSSSSTNRAVEKMVLKRRKRLKSKHAKKFL